MITAHSGCDQTQDNSIDFIKYALSLDADVFEVDIRKSINGSLILSHNETTEESVFLADAFEMLKQHPEKKINCDMKEYDLEDDVFLLAEQYGVDDQLIFTGSVNRELFKKGNVKYPKVAWYANIETFLPDFGEWQRSATDEQKTERLEQLLLMMKDYEVAGLNWNYSDAERVWQKARQLGIGISVYTVNDGEQQKLWLSRNAENITSRNISELISNRKAMA